MRVVVTVGFAVVVVACSGFAALGLALALGLLAVLASGLEVRRVARRLVALELMMGLVVLVLPFTGTGTAVAAVGPLEVHPDGARLAGAIVLRSGAIAALATALLGPLGGPGLGAALASLRVPAKLVLLFAFTERYVHVLAHELRRLERAMRVRCFRPRADRHTYVSYAHLVGMLLVRSLDRSERILDAMRTRGWRGGPWPTLGPEPVALGARDVVFAVAAAALALALIALERA